jgi:hypothetical protein
VGGLVSGIPVPRVWMNRSGKVRLSASPCPGRLADGLGDGLGAVSKLKGLLLPVAQGWRFLLGGGTTPESNEATEHEGGLIDILNRMLNVENLEL